MIQNNNSVNKNKDWAVGSIVHVGFMRNLTVESVEAVKDGMPDIYHLVSVKGKKYNFIPHNGLYAVN